MASLLHIGVLIKITMTDSNLNRHMIISQTQLKNVMKHDEDETR